MFEVRHDGRLTAPSAEPGALLSFTYAQTYNLTGWPALALPCGPAEGGLPASVQLAAPPGLDPLVLAAAAALERALQAA